MTRLARLVARTALPLASIGALVAATPALAEPAHVVLTVPPGSALPSDLAATVSNWRQTGAIADAIWLEENQREGSGFDTFVELDFPNESDYRRWASTQRAKLSSVVEVHPVDAVLHAENSPRDSNYSTFTVTSFNGVQADAAAWKPLLESQRATKTVMRYTLYRDKEAGGRAWLLTEYRDPSAYARGSQAGIDAAAKASGTVTKARYLELPAPALPNLPPYKPETKLTGTLRIFGSELKNSVEYLARGFQQYHPDLRITWSNAPSSEGALAGLYTGIADVAPMGDDAKITDQMPFFNAMGYMPTEISVSTGGYERRGSLFAWAIVVNKDNPLTHLSFDELKDIFGAERSGGWKLENNNWMYTSEYKKDRSTNIRTWDQVGLGNDYRGKEIQTFGYSAPGFQTAIERHWFHWSHKWNPNFMEYVEAKQAAEGPLGEAVKSERPLEALTRNKYAIGIAALMHVKDYPNLKVLALSQHKGGPVIPFTPENVANRSYPLIRDGYFYVNKAPGQPLEPKVREFMSYVLSREGQETIAKVGYYYPLDAKYLAEQRKKLGN